MARRIKSKKRKYLGNRSHGGGNAKNRRGKGNKGGKGRAGWHKHKWLRTIKMGEHKLRKVGFKSVVDKPSTITLEQISHLASMGSLEKSGSGFKAMLNGYKVVYSPNPLGFAIDVTAEEFSKKAREAIEKAGGKATALARKKEPKAPKPAAPKAKGPK